MLALIALLLFSVFGFLAVAADLGGAALVSARLAHAADTVALEAARPGGEPAALEALALGQPAPDVASPYASPPRSEADADGDGLPEVRYAAAAPLLFGQATLLGFTAPDALAALTERRAEGELAPRLDAGGLRERGLELSLASEARLRPVVRVGPPIAGRLPGVAPLALAATCWPDLPDAEAGELDAQLVLVPRSEATPAVLRWSAGSGAGAALGEGCAERAGLALTVGPARVRVGDAIAGHLAAGGLALAGGVAVAYVPLLSAEDVVIGFGRARLEPAAGGGVRVIRGAETLALGNASAHPAPGADGTAALVAQATWLAGRPRAGVLAAPVIGRAGALP